MTQEQQSVIYYFFDEEGDASQSPLFNPSRSTYALQIDISRFTL